MATQFTITSGVVDIMDDWNNPTLQLYITKTDEDKKAFVTIKATLADTSSASTTDADWAVVHSMQVGSGVYVFKVNGTTEGVSYKLVGENCTITDGYYLNE